MPDIDKPIEVIKRSARRAERPEGWSSGFAQRVRRAVLPGFTAFSAHEARLAAAGLQAHFVQLPTFEVAHALDEDLSKRIGDEFSSKEEQQRLVAILLALKDLGSLTSHDRGRETWFFFDPKENSADVAFNRTI